MGEVNFDRCNRVYLFSILSINHQHFISVSFPATSYLPFSSPTASKAITIFIEFSGTRTSLETEALRVCLECGPGMYPQDYS